MSSSTTAAAHQGLELPLLFPGEVTDLIHTRPIRAGRSSPTASTDGRDHRRTAKEQGQNAQANQRAGIGLRRTTSTRGRDAGRNDPGSRRGNCRVDSCDHNVDRRREPGSGSQGTDALGPVTATPFSVTKGKLLQNSPLASTTAPISRSTKRISMFSPGWKPEPQNLTVDPAAGVRSLTVAVGGGRSQRLPDRRNPSSR